MRPINRRRFLQGSVGTAAGMAMASTAASRARAAQSPNETVRIGVMGVRGRGRSLAAEFAGTKGVTVAMLCDVDRGVLESRTAQIADKQDAKPTPVGDFRRILDNKSIDALAVATPDHWHALATLYACQAGKDVYVEKPCSHNIREGRLMIEAARKYGRVIQHGTQSRSGPHFIEAIEFLRSGRLGRVLVAKVWNTQRRGDIGKKPDEPAPAGLDYDMWLGPAPKRPFNRNRFHYQWHWFWDYGTGDIGNDGVHQLDIARWGLGVTHPTAVAGSGRILFFDDDRETPDTQVITYEYPGQSLIYEMRLWTPYNEHGVDNGNVFYGEKGYMQLDRRGWRIVWKGNKPGPKGGPADRGGPHLRNFIDCIKSRGRPNAPIDEAHYSATLSHLGNIVSRTGRRLRFDPKTETFLDDPDANRYLTRSYRAPWTPPQIA